MIYLLSTIKFEVYPNPAQNHLVFSTGVEISGVLKIQNTLGVVVLTNHYNGSSQTLDITSFAKGIYLLVFAPTEGETQAFKFIKN